MARVARSLWVAVLVGLLALGAEAAAPFRAWADAGQPTLVFVTQSDACECQRSLCIAGEQEVVNFLTGNPWGFRLEKVDLKETPQAAKELGILAVPVVFLMDGQGQRVARFDGFFVERDLYRAWEEHRSGEKK